jgi:hypothetical protein
MKLCGFVMCDELLQPVVISRIDGKPYSRKTGAFTRHLRDHGFTYQAYYETFITGVMESCPYCGTSKKFYQKDHSYANTCGSKECAARWTWDRRTSSAVEEINQRRQQTNTERYGGNTPMASKEVREKAACTNMERYGGNTPMSSEEVRKKVRTTCNERYGTSSPLSALTVQEQIKEVQQKKYGGHHMFDTAVREKVVQTNLDRYGVCTTLLHKPTREKGRKSIQERFGTEYASQNDVVKRAIAASRMRHTYMALAGRVGNVTPLFTLEEYGGICIDHKWRCNECSTEFFDDLYAGSMPRCPSCYPKRTSIGEEDMAKFVETCGFDLIRNSRRIIAPYELDIYVPQKNIAIEYCGVYWHSEANGKDRNYHLMKLERCNEQNIHLLTIFEDEWLTNRPLVEGRIRTALGINQKAVYARQCVIAPVDVEAERLFLSLYHSQGYTPSSVAVGLYYGDELVALMTFGRNRFNGDGWELIRYATSTRCVGGASRLFVYFVKQENPTSVVSYADRRWSNDGTMYRAMGFELVSVTKPGYFWVNGGYRYARQKFMKHKLVKEGFDPSKTEVEIMLERGFHRLWDCGHYKFIWRNNKG